MATPQRRHSSSGQTEATLTLSTLTAPPRDSVHTQRVMPGSEGGKGRDRVNEVQNKELSPDIVKANHSQVPFPHPIWPQVVGILAIPATRCKVTAAWQTCRTAKRLEEAPSGTIVLGMREGKWGE